MNINPAKISRRTVGEWTLTSSRSYREPFATEFATETVPFSTLRPAQALLLSDGYDRGYEPLVLADEDLDIIAAYFPAGGEAMIDLPSGKSYSAQWYDTKTGTLTAGSPAEHDATFISPADPAAAHLQDFVLLLTSQETEP